MVMWQFALAAYTLVVAEATVRDAARAASVGDNHEAAAERAAGALLHDVSRVSCDDNPPRVSVTVTLYVPPVPIPLLRDAAIPVVRKAVMPREVESCRGY